MTWQLRRAGEGDLDAIMAIETATFPTDAWSETLMRQELAGAHSYYLVAETVDAPHEIVAYAGLMAPHGSGDADVQTLAVRGDVRRAGLGRTLLLALIAEAGRRGAQQVFLEVRADNPPARALYEANGFEAIGVRPRYYQPDGVDAVVMRRVATAPRTAPAGDAHE
ncbi:ribosomal protein S18-alanine N-acetyltransferase [Herbiconiux sp. L3-i23]|uniref:ribosomal protein S18-alanine N-acetyltransferase n=1 Tax=Herbiconiux sp. L3-i23 TaxID=2905871 RepID=UPI00206087C6|nr:ribosomal protein S18-alanine N-acetyltransferase [Herbiconiux sp. L3-i23]BDI23833.1 ribosomal-protein-alanine acetyltransferase [Herbiconiux sp. L3-i23]